MLQALMAQHVLFYCRDEVATWEILPTTKIKLSGKIIVKESGEIFLTLGSFSPCTWCKALLSMHPKACCDSHVTIFLGVNWSWTLNMKHVLLIVEVTSSFAWVVAHVFWLFCSLLYKISLVGSLSKNFWFLPVKEKKIDNISLIFFVCSMLICLSFAKLHSVWKAFSNKQK